MSLRCRLGLHAWKVFCRRTLTNSHRDMRVCMECGRRDLFDKDFEHWIDARLLPESLVRRITNLWAFNDRGSR